MIILPQEPEKDDPNSINLNFRLPISGERVSRRFLRDDEVEILYKFIDHLTQNGQCLFEHETLGNESVKGSHQHNELF